MKRLILLQVISKQSNPHCFCFDKTLDNISFLVSDNCNTMHALGNLLGKPFVGCYAHKLNLSIKKWLGLYNSDNKTDEQIHRSSLVDRIRDACIEMRTTLNSARIKVELKDDFVQPLLNQETRWTSIHTMITRFLEICDKTWNPTTRTYSVDTINKFGVLTEVRDLNKQMVFLNDAMISVQEQNVSINIARQMFDIVLAKFPEMSEYLGENAEIIANAKFDSGVNKVLSNNEHLLTEDEKAAISQFKLDEEVEMVIESNNNEFRSLLASAKRKRPITNYDIEALAAIPATSCEVERCFSRAGWVMDDRRCSMSEDTFDAKMILLINQTYWKNEYKDKTQKTIKNQRGWLLMEKVLQENTKASTSANT